MLDADWEVVAASKSRAEQGDGESGERSCDHEGSPIGKRNLTPEQIASFQTAFDKDASGAAAQNAASKQDVYGVTLSRQLLQTSLSPSFSVQVPGSRNMPVTNQKQSGRCWLFGTLNLFRFATQSTLGAEFEFSESFLYFFHLLEQANFFLNRILATVDQPIDGRYLSMLLDCPIDDGGDWTIAMNLVHKYGLVPKTVYPETYSSSHTDSHVTVLTDLLRAAARQIREPRRVADSSSCRGEEGFKQYILSQVYRILCIHLGTPPTRFLWQYRQQGSFHREPDMTPHSFLQQYVLDHCPTPRSSFFDYVALINDPRHPYFQCYTVEESNPMTGGADTIFVNVPIAEMKHIAVQMLKDEVPVWFACNVDEELDDDEGLWDQHLYKMAQFYGVASFQDAMSKSDRINYGYPMGTHVMLITAVDLETTTTEDGDSNIPARWRVENSWGAGTGDGGYYTMNDNWFAKNVFEVVVPPEYLSSAAADALSRSPTVLPPWDPMTKSKR